MKYEKESAPFYHRAAWKRVRRMALERDCGMCQDCMKRLRDGYGMHPNRATMVHHIEPVENRPDLALDLDNLVSLCEACHNQRHPEKGGDRSGKEQPKHNMRVIKV